MLAAATQQDEPSTGPGPARRIATVVVAAGVVLTGLAACSNDAATPQDAYALGCPAIDAAVNGSGAAKDAAIKGLEAIRDSGKLDPQPTEFVQSAIKALKSSSLKDLPADTRKSLIKGCADHGHPLENVS